MAIACLFFFLLVIVFSVRLRFSASSPIISSNYICSSFNR